MAVVKGLKRNIGAHTVAKQEPLSVGEEIDVLLKGWQLDPEHGACVQVHDAAVPQQVPHHCCPRPCEASPSRVVLVKHHQAGLHRIS